MSTQHTVKWTSSATTSIKTIRLTIFKQQEKISETGMT
jgi:hypothetical protein